jgi:AraC family transcriptional regulator of arabinose operon
MLIVHEVRQDSGMNGLEQPGQPASACQLIFVTYGKCVYWVERERFILDKGSVLLIPLHVSFYGKNVPTVFHAKYVISFNLAGEAAESPMLKSPVLELPMLELPVLAEGKPISWKLGKYDMVHEWIRSMHSCWTERRPYFKTMCLGLLLQVLACWGEELAQGKISAEKLRHVERMREYILNHHRDKVTKEVLGDYIERSPNYAATLFRQVTGRTISDQVNANRVKTAIHMLEHSKLTVGEIALFLGYSDAAYFHKVFKRLTGDNPSKYMAHRESRTV